MKIVEAWERQSSRDVWTMTSNTGCTSERELAITFRISAVADCRCRACPSSLASLVTLVCWLFPERPRAGRLLASLDRLEGAALRRGDLSFLPRRFLSRAMSAQPLRVVRNG